MALNTVRAGLSRILLADAGLYFVAHNGGAGVASAAAPTAFSDTAPMFTVFNPSASGKNIYMDRVLIRETAAGTGGTGLQLKLVLDATAPTVGTQLTPVNVNGSSTSAAAAVPRIFPTGVTQSGSSRVLVGTFIAIPTQTAPLAANSEVLITFGNEALHTSYDAAASANIAKFGYNWSPAIIPPGWSLSFQHAIPAQSAASSWTVEAGWFEQ